MNMTFPALLAILLSAASATGTAGQDNPQAAATRTIIEVPQAVLEEYVGEYQLLPEMVMKITLEEGKLYATPTGQQKAELFPFEQDQFFLTLVDATISFGRDEQGKIASLTILQNGEPFVAPRKS